MSNPNHRGPRPLSEVLNELFTVRGYSRLQARQELEEAWSRAVGEEICRKTRLGELRRGVLNVTVAHSTLLEELAAFRKPALLAALRTVIPASAIQDIRFWVGAIEDRAEPKRRVKSSWQVKGDGPEPLGGRTLQRRSGHQGDKQGRDSGPGRAEP
jgi:predicted nucleic acid-binding Zn ribbon protein